ncbi:MAG: hypothetical protein KAU31_10515 [Spirochaetaceae bacterium]|nr:hypothetical protein [Spirochaetaceae bacterium]
MGRVSGWIRRLLAVAAMALALLLVVASCENTVMLNTVRSLVLTGEWDEGTFDRSIFGE